MCVFLILSLLKRKEIDDINSKPIWKANEI